MAVEVRIPTLGESVTEGVIVRWIKKDGEAVNVDDPLLELETDKAAVEIPAEMAGVLQTLRKEGDTVQVGDVVARIEAGAAAKRAPSPQAAQPPASDQPRETKDDKPAASDAPLSPAVRKLVEEHRLDPEAIKASGRGGRLTKGDVLAHLDTAPLPDTSVAVAEAPPPPETVPAKVERKATGDSTERVPMTRLRQRIAERLVQAQHTAAILTTFNEVDMSAVMDLRSRHKDRFKELHGVGLGFMSFFTRACVQALKDVPVVNARIDGTDVVYNRAAHIGVAVSTERGLIVPVLHNADQLSFAEIESEILRLAGLARQNKLSIEDLSGGTFSISNGGTFGSLMSTPILNPPQSAILGMHKIEKRPIVVNDQIVIRPMMYLAVSYDHRLIDGEQAVTFLVRVKERLEDPTRLLLEV